MKKNTSGRAKQSGSMVLIKKVSEREKREMMGTYSQRNNRIMFHWSKSGHQSSYFEGSKYRESRDEWNNIPTTYLFRIWEYQG